MVVGAFTDWNRDLCRTSIAWFHSKCYSFFVYGVAGQPTLWWECDWMALADFTKHQCHSPSAWQFVSATCTVEYCWAAPTREFIFPLVFAIWKIVRAFPPPPLLLCIVMNKYIYFLTQRMRKWKWPQSDSCYRWNYAVTCQQVWLHQMARRTDKHPNTLLCQLLSYAMGLVDYVIITLNYQHLFL